METELSEMAKYFAEESKEFNETTLTDRLVEVYSNAYSLAQSFIPNHAVTSKIDDLTAEYDHWMD